MAFRPGDYKVVCDRSGATVMASECRKMWDGSFVLKSLWEPRHPQDFAPTIRKEPLPENPRPEGDERFIDAGDITAADL